MEEGYYALSNSTFRFIDKNPVWGPVLHTFLRAGYLYGFYLLREKDMNWPFSSEAPLRFEYLNLGISVMF